MNLTEISAAINALRISLLFDDDSVAADSMGPLAEQEYLQALAYLDMARLSMAKAAIFRAREMAGSVR